MVFVTSYDTKLAVWYSGNITKIQGLEGKEGHVEGT